MPRTDAGAPKPAPNPGSLTGVMEQIHGRNPAFPQEITIYKSLDPHLLVEVSTGRGAKSGKFSSLSGSTYPLNSWRSFLRTHSEVKMLVTQLCLTLCDPTDCSPQGSSVHGILQARILEWVACSFSRGSSRPRDRTRVSCTAGRFCTI